MGVHGILESLNWIDEELMDMRSDRNSRRSVDPEDPRPDWEQLGWTSAEAMEGSEVDSRWYPDPPPPADPWEDWEENGYPSREAAMASVEAHQEKLLLERANLNHEFRLEEDMWTAIEAGDSVTLKYLLEQGTDPHMLSSMQRTGALATACYFGKLECAKLLREYGAYLTCDYDREEPWSVPSQELIKFLAPPPEQDAYDHRVDPEGFRHPARSRAGKWARRQMRREAGYAVEEVARLDALLPVADWLASRPPRGSKGPVWSDAERGPPNPGPWRSWEERFPIPPGVKKYAVWDALSWHRAVRAHHSPLRCWARVRKLVKKRGIALYWQERTQANLCAEGGEGRKRDRETFEVEMTEWSDC